MFYQECPKCKDITALNKAEEAARIADIADARILELSVLGQSAADNNNRRSQDSSQTTS